MLCGLNPDRFTQLCSAVEKVFLSHFLQLIFFSVVKNRALKDPEELVLWYVLFLSFTL